MSSLRILLLFLIALACLVGCGDGGDKFVGTYVGKQDLSKAGQDLDKQTAPAKLREQIAKVQFGLELRQDKTATLQMAGIPGAQPISISGTWEYKDRLVTVTLTPPGGGGAATPMQLAPSPDGKTLVTGGSQFGSLSFTKS